MEDPANNDVTTLRGGHLSTEFDDASVDKQNAGRHKMALFQYHLYTMTLSYYFGDFQKAKKMLKLLPADIWAGAFTFAVPVRILYTGLIYTALCRESTGTKRVKYQHRAHLASKKLSNWSKKGTVNFFYMASLLQAENRSISAGEKQTMQILNLYDKAIMDAKELEILNHVALANELTTGFIMTRKGGKKMARKYLEEAIQYYELWGSRVKVDDLRFRYRDIMAALLPEESSGLSNSFSSNPILK